MFLVCSSFSSCAKRQSCSYDGCAAVVLGGLEGGVELGKPVNAASQGEVVESGSSHCVGLDAENFMRTVQVKGCQSLELLG